MKAIFNDSVTLSFLLCLTQTIALFGRRVKASEMHHKRTENNDTLRLAVRLMSPEWLPTEL